LRWNRTKSRWAPHRRLAGPEPALLGWYEIFARRRDAVADHMRIMDTRMTSGDINHGVSNLEVGPQRQGEGVRLLALGGFLVK
jgi:hypothetical protein